MVAVRAKVGQRSCQRSTPLKSGKSIFKIDCSVPFNDGVFDGEMVSAFEQYFLQNTKLHGKKGKLADKVKIVLDKDKATLQVATTMKYRKKYFKYLTKKFLKKKNMRDFFRVLRSDKNTYQLRYFNIQEE
jgi:large subunit ribosomal protein L22e